MAQRLGWGVMLTIHLHLDLMLRMSGAIPLLPLRAFTAWTGKILPFTFTFVPFFIFLPLLISVRCTSSFYTVLQPSQ